MTNDSLTNLRICVHISLHLQLRLAISIVSLGGNALLSVLLISLHSLKEVNPNQLARNLSERLF